MSLFTVMFIVGILCCYQVLIFSMGASTVPPEMRNVTIAFLNSINMLGGIFFHTIIGAHIDVFWMGEISGGQRVYEAISYEYPIWVIPSAAFSGGLLFLFLRLLGKPVSLRVVQS
jgi:hypothetical protein